MRGKLSAEELKALFASDAVFALIDAREQSEHQTEQILRSTQISLRDLIRIVGHLVPRKNTQLVLYSGEEKRAGEGAALLREEGYSEVAVLAGGLRAWKEAGEEVYAGIHVFSKLFGEVLYHSGREEIREITGEALYDRIAAGEDVRVIDVRPVNEVAETGTVPGAVNIPGVELPFYISDQKREGRQIVLTCAGRTRGYVAAAGIGLLGLAGVLDLENGTKGWHFAGHEIEPLAEGHAFAELPGPSAEAAEAARRALQSLAVREGIPLISAEELRRAIAGDRPVNLLDVRQEEEYRSGHIRGSRSFPGGQAVQNTDESAFLHGALHVFTDDGDGRAILTAYWFTRMKLRAAVLAGGNRAWREAGGEWDSGTGFDEQWHDSFTGRSLEEEHRYIEWEKELINKKGRNLL